MVLHFALLALLMVSREAEGRDRPDEGFEPVAAESSSDETRAGWEKRMRSELSELDTELEELEDEARELGFRARKRTQRELRTLRRRQDEIEDRVREVRRSSSRRWDIAKGGVDDALHELELMLDRLDDERKRPRDGG